MFGMSWLEIIGYVGSCLVAVSLMMKSIIKLRWINLIGATTFSIYGFLLNAYPVFVLNTIITIVDIFYIISFYYKKDFFEIFEVGPTNTRFFKRFLEFNKSDIQKFFPDKSFKENKNPVIFFILRNMLPVGLFIGDIKEKNTLEIKLDYVIPGYRDFKIARYVYFKKADFFLDKGINNLRIKSTVPKHDSFLLKMGFQKRQDQSGVWFSYKF
jgi:hypothetical protein